MTGVEHTMLIGGYITPEAGRRTFRDYAEAWRSGQPHRPGTVKAVEQHLRCYAYPAFGSRPIAGIRPSEVQAWATDLPIAASTTRTVFNTIKAVFKAAVRDRIIAHNPCDGVALPTVPRRKIEPLSVEQVETIIGSAPDEYRALLVLAAGTGLRSGELFGLQVRHVDFLRRLLTVEQQVQQLAGHSVYVCPPKTTSFYRTIPLPQVVVEALAAHLRACPGRDRRIHLHRARGRAGGQDFVHALHVDTSGQGGGSGDGHRSALDAAFLRQRTYPHPAGS